MVGTLPSRVPSGLHHCTVPSIMETNRSPLRALLATLTVTAAEVAVLLPLSRATAVRTWFPDVVVVLSQLTEYGAVVTSVPREAPSSLNWTPATATLSVAVADTDTVPWTVAPELGAVMLTVGGVASLETVTLTAAARAVLPAASRATAPREWVP